MKFRDRKEAGSVLADLLNQYKNNQNVIVLGLPRGGVPVAYEIATKLQLPLDIFLVRKLGVPFHKELAMGAIASGEVKILNESLIKSLQIPTEEIDAVAKAEEQELLRREHVYRGKKPFPNLREKTVILVDDGIATGATMKVAIAALKQKHAAKIVVAVPVSAKDTFTEIKGLVDDIICPLILEEFYAVGLWYYEFPQTTDEEVIELLKNKPSPQTPFPQTGEGS